MKGLLDKHMVIYTERKKNEFTFAIITLNSVIL